MGETLTLSALAGSGYRIEAAMIVNGSEQANHAIVTATVINEESSKAKPYSIKKTSQINAEGIPESSIIAHPIRRYLLGPGNFDTLVFAGLTLVTFCDYVIFLYYH